MTTGEFPGLGSVSGPFALHATVTATDPSEYERLAAPWELLASPLAAGPFQYRREHFVTSRLILYRESTSPSLALQGLAPRDFLAFAAPVRRGGDSRYWGRRPTRTNLPAVSESAIDVRYASGHEQVLLMLRRSELRRRVPERTFDVLDHLARAYRFPVDSDIARSFAAWGNRTLRAVCRNDELCTSAAAVTSIEDDAFRWAEVIADASRTGIDPGGHQKAVASALQFLAVADLDTLTVPRVAEAAGVSRRTLAYAFREALGTSVLTHIRRRQLHLARQDLLHASLGDTRVADVATRHGFYDHGRFAGAYRRRFGELPSTTLATPPPRRQRSLVFG